VRRALDSFGDAEVHVVLSARDLARQIPAEWQENVKHRRVIGYRDFLTRITDPDRKGALASWFWGVQEVPDILDRWGATLPPQRVHLVTVPKRGAPPGLLWERFAAVFEIDPHEYAPESRRSNPSLGVPESALLRRINQRVNNGVLANQHYREFVRELLAHRSLSTRRDSPRLSLPDEERAWAAQLSQGWIDTLAGRGYDVVGTLEDLRPDPVSTPFVDPDHPDEERVADAAMQAIVSLLGEAARLREIETSLRTELDIARRELGQVRGPVRRGVVRVKQRLVRAADHNAVARVGLRAYRRVRGSSSRSA
jgi:hypothetical protein